MNVKRVLAPLAILAGLCLASCAAPPVPIAFSSQGKTRYLRCNLKAFENRMYISNYIAPQNAIGGQAGSPAEVTMFSQQRIDLTVNKIPYQMYPISVPITGAPDQILARYLVDDKESIGLEKMDNVKRQNILNGIFSVGMTKEEIYIALGPPLWVDFDTDASNIPIEAIMDKNRWVYTTSNIMGFLGRQVFVFADGKLTTTIQ